MRKIQVFENYKEKSRDQRNKEKTRGRESRKRLLDWLTRSTGDEEVGAVTSEGEVRRDE